MNEVEVTCNTNNTGSKNDDKEMCQCRKCGYVFHQSEVSTVHNKVAGRDIEEKVSPCCRGRYGLMIYPIDEEFNTYKSKKFFNKK